MNKVANREELRPRTTKHSLHYFRSACCHDANGATATPTATVAAYQDAPPEAV